MYMFTSFQVNRSHMAPGSRFDSIRNAGSHTEPDSSRFTADMSACADSIKSDFWLALNLH